MLQDDSSGTTNEITLYDDYKKWCLSGSPKQQAVLEAGTSELRLVKATYLLYFLPDKNGMSDIARLGPYLLS
jgi:hypothetical protein